ncbi:S8 family peptidase [Bacteroides fragilis]|nr:S8 family peptidase [Bacteroides fragilis]
MIEPINAIKPADIHALYTSTEDFDKLPDNKAFLFELWITKTKEYDTVKLSDVLDKLAILKAGKNHLDFDGVDVWMIKATKQQLCELPLSIGYIEGVRPYHQPSILIKNRSESREWSELIEGEIQFALDKDSTRIGLLDSGVNNAHKLLAPALPNDRMKSAISVPDTTDHSDHGTGMAGLMLYGDLTDITYRHGGPIIIEQDLASVKIVENGHTTDPDFYGAVIEDAIYQAQTMGASIQCMAVTDGTSYDGKSTSSSASLDESIYHNGKCDRLVLVSAGNIEPPEVDATNYLESCKANAVQSPAQAWNALTVGAYTEKTIVTDESYKALAAPGNLSPMSRSSWSWRNGCNKPEIVMEGGNIAYHPVFQTTTHPDLSLITTCQDLAESLEQFHATSAATALATRLAAKIKTATPALSMLSVRGMMVHSAKWTPEMIRIGNIKDIIPLCGYGVPDEETALFSNEKYATFIFENELIPYWEKDGSNTYNQLHFYDLPWPTEVLEQMGEENVKIRITLSYYVKPSPGYAGRSNKYRYPSATLHFDLKSASESMEEFLCRRNKSEGEKRTDNDTNRWTIKQQRREQGTVQSDWIECTAAELASCGQIIIYPGQGWWKERKLANVDNVIKYSLIVSIETTKTEIYDAVETAISNRIGVQIMQEV